MTVLQDPLSTTLIPHRAVTTTFVGPHDDDKVDIFNT